MEIKFRDECFDKLKVDNLEHYNDVSDNIIPMLIVLLNDVMDFIRYFKREPLSLKPNIGNFSDTFVDTNDDWEEFRDIVSNVCIYGEKYGIQVILSTKYDLKYADLEDLNSFFNPIDYEDFKKKVQKIKPLNNSSNQNGEILNKSKNLMKRYVPPKEPQTEKGEEEKDENGKIILHLQHND